MKRSEAWARLRGGELTPWRAAASVGVGLAIGVTPLWGLHLPIVLAICVPLRLDAPVAYLAANISLPFISPFLSLTEIEIGSWVRTGHGLPLDAAHLRTHGVGAFVVEIVLGTLIFSPAVAFLGGGLTWWIRKQANDSHLTSRALSGTPSMPAPSVLDEALPRVLARYRTARRATYYYVRSKLAGDPVARRIATLGANDALGDLTDVGCGRGQLAVLLLEARCATSVRGFDWDSAKIDDARRAAEGLHARFDVGDVKTHPIEPCDTVLLVDVLHYLTDEEQDALLTRAAHAARTRIFVRDLDPDRGWRSAVTQVQETLTTTLRWNRGARVRPRPIPSLTCVLEAAGFAVEVAPCWEGTPFANVLVVATRSPTP